MHFRQRSQETANNIHGPCNIAGERHPTATTSRSGDPHRTAIDLRRFEPHERVPLLEMSLSVLAPGESLQATFEDWPAALVRYLERTCRERFEWWFAGAGEEWCVLEMRRLPQPL